MTADEWNAATSPTPMLEFLRGKASERKLRLFGCACVRRVWHHLPDVRYRHAVEVAEQYADGLVDEDALAAASDSALQTGEEWRRETTGRPSMEVWLVLRAYRAASGTLSPNDLFSAGSCLSEAARAEGIEELLKSGREQPVGDEFYRFMAQLVAPYCTPLRCIFGNPFSPPHFDPCWRTSTVVALATQMYDTRDFSATPILADALQDSGCESEVILNHLRGPGPHVRGCWVIDLILGKA